MPATNELLQEGRYRIGQRTNASGDVFEAYDTVRNTNVVVREIPVRLNKVATVSQRESLKLAFTTQAKALTEIEHDALLHVHDFFSEIDRQYLVMESVDGSNLRELLSQHKRAFSVDKVTEWADQLLDALNYLHTRKPSIIHRNIRPENLIVTATGQVKLLGVGLESGGEIGASQAEGADLRYSPMEQIWPGLDPASQKVITNSYDERSERILKEPADARSDIYSLGATLYFLMTGSEPVDPLERSIDILEGKLDPLREPTKVNSQIDPEISDVLMKALEVKRENRYDSALIMRTVLQTALERIADRENDEDLEQKEAAEIIRLAALAKDEAAVGVRDSEAEQNRQNELLDQQRRDAEEADRAAAEAEKQRLAKEEAERAAAEAERQRLAKEESDRAAAEAEKQRLAQEEADRAAARAEKERLAREEAERATAEAEKQRLAKEEADRAAAEAEKQRLAQEEADRQAEEADRLRREKEEAENAIAQAVAEMSRPEENVLDIPAGAEVVAYKQTEDVDEHELAAVLKELEEVDAVVDEPAADHDDVQVIESPVDLAPQPGVSDASEDTDDDLFAVPERSGRSLPMPAIAGAAVLVVVIVVGGWFAMSGSSEPPKPEPAQVAPVTQTAPVETAPVDTITSTQAQPDANTAAVETSMQDPAATAKAAATPKTKKAEAKPQTDKKKAVTVDDLINDN